MKLNDESILRNLRKKTNRPMKIAELAKCLAVPEPDRREFRNRIKDLAQQGRLVRIRGGRYGLAEEMNLIPGTLNGHPNGYGFVTPEGNVKEEDIYISRRNLGGAMHTDRVMVRIESNPRFARPEGRVIRILERGTTSLVGTYEPLDREGWVIPMETRYFHDVYIPAKDKGGAKPRQVVVVELVDYPTHHQPPVGRVTEVLGYADDPEVEIRSLFRKHHIHTEFSPEVLEEAKEASTDIAPEERKIRQDITDWTVFTIDGETAKDFDDAVSIESTNEGCRLGVHIADVSHFVKDGSLLDKEAFGRGTSIYFPDGVIPMLPFELSNHICSLKPGVERLTLSVLIDFDREANVIKYDIFPSIIHSRRRFTYTRVARILAGEVTDEDGAFLNPLHLMHKLSRKLRKHRFERGSVDFRIPEPQIHINDKGQVDRISIAEHNEAHELIEEFMLSANRVIAKFLHDKKVPSIHRIHERPDEDKLESVREFLGCFGLKMKSPRTLQSIDLHRMLLKARHRPEERVVNTLLLRSMKRARYSEIDPGHFCLGFDHYTHFTSPIRRYPDLITHRMVKAFLRKKCSQKEHRRLLPHIAECADQSSLMEDKAKAIERDINDLRRAQYMADKIGNLYSGMIVSVTAFGFFVELSEVFVEGLIRLSRLTDDYYIYIEPEHKLMGQRRHRIFKIGDSVKVRVVEVDIANRQIELSLAQRS